MVRSASDPAMYYAVTYHVDNKGEEKMLLFFPFNFVNIIITQVGAPHVVACMCTFCLACVLVSSKPIYPVAVSKTWKS